MSTKAKGLKLEVYACILVKWHCIPVFGPILEQFFRPRKILLNCYPVPGRTPIYAQSLHSSPNPIVPFGTFRDPPCCLPRASVLLIELRLPTRPSPEKGYAPPHLIKQQMRGRARREARARERGRAAFKIVWFYVRAHRLSSRRG